MNSADDEKRFVAALVKRVPWRELLLFRRPRTSQHGSMYRWSCHVHPHRGRGMLHFYGHRRAWQESMGSPYLSRYSELPTTIAVRLRSARWAPRSDASSRAGELENSQFACLSAGHTCLEAGRRRESGQGDPSRVSKCSSWSFVRSLERCGAWVSHVSVL